MNENHNGPNIDAIPVQKYVSDGPTLVGKQCLCNGKVLGSIPRDGNLCSYDRMGDTMEIFYFWFLLLFLCFDFAPLLGIPENAGFMQHFRPLLGPPIRGHGGRCTAAGTDRESLCPETQMPPISAETSKVTWKNILLAPSKPKEVG